MENQGYVEEQSRAEKKQFTLESRCLSGRQLHHANTIDGDASVTESITTQPESHVYEDISASVESPSKFPERASLPDETQNTRENTQARRSADFTKQAWASGTSSIVSPEDKKSCQQDATLSSSAGISANRDSVNSSSRAISRTSEDDTEVSCKNPCDLSGPALYANVEESTSSSPRQNENSSHDATAQSERKPNRRRRKKDCRQCRSKLAGANTCEKLGEPAADSKDTILKRNESDNQSKSPDASNFFDSLLKAQNIKIYPILNRTGLRDFDAKKGYPVAFPVPENGPHLTDNAANLLASTRNEKMLHQIMGSNQNKLLKVPKNEAGMRINSIYSHDRWHGKDARIFYTDFKDQIPFQKAYSLPVRAHTPTSQNRVNLRRSVRNDPPPHPARLDKHRRGWTLHLVRPLKTPGCSCSLVPLLIIVLILLGVAGVALYIFFEPEKLEIIQQYLKSSDKLTGQNVTSGESLTPIISSDEPDLVDTANTSATIVRTSVDMLAVSVPLNGDPSFPQISSSSTDTEMGDASEKVANATRYCDDCLDDEVCVALVDEEVPICRTPRDPEDPTGCAGFCAINKQKCHRLDMDAFRCLEVEHYCLEDEWTCSNTLCIPMEKHCDGHMNCYDHSDEYDCVCDLETHFQCGNETSCLPLERRCDGKIDCWDATDEINCTLACPLEGEFTCNDGECISKTRFCDGLADCSDGSDEPHGCQGRCNKHEFTCQNRRCITKALKCNGVDDCGDGTDERYCKDRFT